MLRDPESVAPFCEWAERQLDLLSAEDDPVATLVVSLGWSRDAGARRLYRFRSGESKHAEWADLYDALFEANAPIWELYPERVSDLEACPNVKAVDSRGRDLTARRGVPPKLTDAQVEAAYRLHMEGGLSMRELARRGWQTWGYANEKSALNCLSVAFKRLDLVARDRVEATVKASTVHGLAPRRKRGNRAALDYRRQQRVERGEIRGVRCQGVRTQHPRKGEPCQLFALEGGVYCIAHDPDRAAEREANLARARAAPG